MVGGDGVSNSNSVEILSTDQSLTDIRIANLPNDLSVPKNNPSLFVHDGSLLLCGGEGNLKDCHEFKNGKWTKHSTLENNRKWASAVTTQSGTYIFGGISSATTYEFLPAKSKSWERFDTKIPNGFKTGCAVEIPGEEILLIGGFNTFRRLLKYNIETETFEELDTKLKNGRIGQNCALMPGDNTKVVITGGQDSDFDALDSTEILDLKDFTISNGSPMNDKRADHGIGSLVIDGEEKLVVFGGKDDSDPHTSLEVFNPRTLRWEFSSALSLKDARNQFGYVTVPNEVISKL